MFDLEFVVTPVSAALGSLRRQLDDVSTAWDQIGAEAVVAALPYVPVLSGALADTLRAAGGRDGVDVSAGGQGVVYARIQNARFRFMNAVADELENQAPTELEAEIARRIRLVGLN